MKRGRGTHNVQDVGEKSPPRCKLRRTAMARSEAGSAECGSTRTRFRLYYNPSSH